MPLTVQNGALVVRGGSLATEQACCCDGGGPCDAPFVQWTVAPLPIVDYVECHEGGNTGDTSADAAAFVDAYIEDANTFAQWLRDNGWSNVSVFGGQVGPIIISGFPEGPCDGNNFKVFQTAVIVTGQCCEGGQTENSRTCDFFQDAPRTAETVGFNFDGELVDASDVYYGCGNAFP